MSNSVKYRLLMHTVYFDSLLPDDTRRQQLFEGQLFVYSSSPSVQALSEFAKELIEEGFGNVDPTIAQFHFAPDEFEQILSRVKPKFINHARSKELVVNILKEFGCNPRKTYFDVPRMRISTSDQYLTTGLAYSFDPHRDTWFSAPFNQINWWLPIYEIESENCLAFHPKYWNEPINNGSLGYHCDDWYAESRRLAATGEKDARKRPQPLEPIELEPQIRVVCPAGGVILFSGAHLHSTVPNTSGKTRWSIDFRTVHIDDVISQHGAPNLDSYCKGSLMRDFKRATDLSPIPNSLQELYKNGTPISAARPYKLFA